MKDEYKEAPCPICQSTTFQWGAAHSKGIAVKCQLDTPPKQLFWTSKGDLLHARVCTTCDNVQLFVEGSGPK